MRAIMDFFPFLIDCLLLFHTQFFSFIMIMSFFTFMPAHNPYQPSIAKCCRRSLKIIQGLAANHRLPFDKCNVFLFFYLFFYS
jgi:hypothetical protein